MDIAGNLADNALDIAADNLRRVRFAPVEHRAHGRTAPRRDIGGKMRVKAHRGDHLLAVDRARQRGIRINPDDPLDIGAAGKVLDDFVAPVSAIAIEHADRDMLDFHRRSIAEQQQLDQRRQDQRYARTRIAQHRPQFLDDDRDQTWPEQRGDHAILRRVARTVATKNSAPNPSSAAMSGANSVQSSPAINTVCNCGIRYRDGTR